MSDIKYGVCLGDMTMTATETVRLGQKLEDWGFDAVWMADHLIDIEGAVADPYAVFGYLAAVTKKLFLCAAVSDCQRVHPAKMAHIVATLDEISEGRAGLGIGAGESMNTLPFGLPFEDDPMVRLARLREYIQVVKLLWGSSAAEPVSFAGEHYTLTDAWIDQKPYTRPHPPIHVGALGSNTALRITAELGDGWQPFFSTPGYYAKRRDYLLAHLEKQGRDPDAVERSCWVYFAITDDPAEEQRLLGELAPFCVAERGSLKHAGFDLSQLPTKDYHFARLVVSDDKKLEGLVNVANQIPTELVKKMHAVGPADEVAAFFRGHIEAGVQHFIINPCMAPDPQAALEAFSQRVLPQLKT